jgi:DNA invertase Pin-like site-specific DNA recombinase
VLVVWRLDRLGRNLPDLVWIVGELEGNKVGLESITEKIETVSSAGKLVFHNHVYAEIADILNRQGLRPGGSARPRRSSTTFTALRVAYLVHRYKVRSRYDRLRDCGMLTAAEAATHLGVHEATVVHWAEHGIITRHAHNAHAYLYELPDSTPVKHSSRWDQLSDRAQAHKREKEAKASDRSQRGVV